MRITHSLVGTKFKHKSCDEPIYKIIKIIDDKYLIYWGYHSNNCEYTIKEVEKFFSLGTWVKIKHEN